MEHVLRKLLFPAPIASYDWSSMQGELICVVGRFVSAKCLDSQSFAFVDLNPELPSGMANEFLA
jgi:hypothetical protein